MASQVQDSGCHSKEEGKVTTPKQSGVGGCSGVREDKRGMMGEPMVTFG